MYAIAHAETIDTSGLPEGLRSRRAQVHIDMAWAYSQHRDDAAVVVNLMEAERVAPQALRYNVIVREMLRELLKRERKSATPGLRRLAGTLRGARMTTPSRVVYVIGTAAPPVRDLHRLIELLYQRGWQPCPVLTPTAATWVDVEQLGQAAGFPVRVEPRLPEEEDPLPAAEAVLAAPLSFNTLNKWAAGISDTLALGLLNELLSTDTPIIAAPCVKDPLRAHPAYAASYKMLESCGVSFLAPERTILRPRERHVTLDWLALTSALG